MIEDLVLHIPSDEGLESWNVINSIGTVAEHFLLIGRNPLGCQVWVSRALLPCFYSLKRSSVTKIGTAKWQGTSDLSYVFVHFRKEIPGFGGLIQGQIYNPEWGRWIWMGLYIWDKPGTCKHPFRTWQFCEFVTCLGWWVKTWPSWNAFCVLFFKATLPLKPSN